MRIGIDTGNAAFEMQPGLECARILRDLADRLEREGLPPANDSWYIRDYNGNHVGLCTSVPWSGDGQ